MKSNSYLNVIMSILFFFGSRVEASNAYEAYLDHTSKLSYFWEFQEALLAIPGGDVFQIVRNLVAKDPSPSNQRCLDAMTEHNMYDILWGIELRRREFNQLPGQTGLITPPMKFYSLEKPSPDSTPHLPLDAFGNIPKGLFYDSLVSIIKEFENKSSKIYIKMSFMKNLSSASGMIFLHPYHLKSMPPVLAESFLETKDFFVPQLQCNQDVENIISAALSDSYGYRDPYGVYVALGALESRGADRNSEALYQKFHENILDFISHIHTLQSQREDGVVLIEGREHERELLIDQNGEALTVQDLLHDVDVGDIQKFLIDPYFTSALPFSDAQRTEVENALRGKGFWGSCLKIVEIISSSRPLTN